MKDNISSESIWRSIILLGKNSACYKFALAKSLISLSGSQSEFSLENIAVPFSEEITKHLKNEEKQGTSQSSKFLEICKNFNNNNISYDELIDGTVKYGFINVLDAFHNISNGQVPLNFFGYDKINKKIILTDEMHKLILSDEKTSLLEEIEARWRLVETAWSLNIPKHHINVKYDENESLLYIIDKVRRKNITGIRDALNGYQNGKCFYCGKPISKDGCYDDVDVDHFFPHMLQRYNRNINLDGAWNLVLSCIDCNRGESGKFEKIPDRSLLQRLENRNNYLIASNHPLKETLINQTGKTFSDRRKFLNFMDKFSIDKVIVRWFPLTDFKGNFSLEL